MTSKPLTHSDVTSFAQLHGFWPDMKPRLNAGPLSELLRLQLPVLVKVQKRQPSKFAHSFAQELKSVVEPSFMVLTFGAFM